MDRQRHLENCTAQVYFGANFPMLNLDLKFYDRKFLKKKIHFTLNIISEFRLVFVAMIETNLVYDLLFICRVTF